MLNAMIFHGTGETSESFWYPYVEDWLESEGYDVWVPDIPDFDNPELTRHLPFVLENGKFTEDTILIAHSAGCPLVLAALEKINTKVSKAILVSGFIEPLNLDFDRILKDGYDWDRIRNNFEDIFIININNDPWGSDVLSDLKEGGS